MRERNRARHRECRQRGRIPVLSRLGFPFFHFRPLPIVKTFLDQAVFSRSHPCCFFGPSLFLDATRTRAAFLGLSRLLGCLLLAR
jgi:hypothetical protein